MPYIKAKDGTDLYVKDWGSGRPIVLIHGWPLSADSWDDIAYGLASAGYRVIFYDRRGFGRSGQPWTGYNYDTLADDLSEVIQATGVRDVTIAGFSMGGGEVARYLSRHGGRNVAKAALISSVVPHVQKTEANPNGVPREKIEEIKAGLLKDRPGYYASFFQQFYGQGLISHPVSSEVLHWTQMMAMQAGLQPTIAALDAWAYTDFTGDLPAFNLPTLIVHGTSDKAVPLDATSAVAARAIPNARFLEYSGAPHGLTVTEKDRLIGDLKDFLAL